MIVRDEEKNLTACLAPIAKLFQEIIIVDTGSSDKTEEIAATFGAKVFDFPWRENFAAARNESLRHASADWVFSFDADDRLSETNVQKLEKIFSSLPEKNFAYYMPIWSAPDDMLDCRFVVDQIRLFRRDPAHRWEYRVHEQILPGRSKRPICLQRCDHSSFWVRRAETRQRKRRNLRLLRMDAEEHRMTPTCCSIWPTH